MSKRCELQKEYYKQFGNYKGDGKYSDHYVNWLESRVLELRAPDVSESQKCEDCGRPLPEGMKYKCYECYDDIYCPK